MDLCASNTSAGIAEYCTRQDATIASHSIEGKNNGAMVTIATMLQLPPVVQSPDGCRRHSCNFSTDRATDTWFLYRNGNLRNSCCI